MCLGYSINVAFISAIFFCGYSEIPPAYYVFSTICINLLFLLPVTDPILIMWHKDVKESIEGIKLKLMKKWCPSLVKQEEIAEQITLDTLNF